jgi:hypothetical protein
MHRVRPAFRLAQEMGARLGDFEILLRALSRHACAQQVQPLMVTGDAAPFRGYRSLMKTVQEPKLKRTFLLSWGARNYW